MNDRELRIGNFLLDACGNTGEVVLGLGRYELATKQRGFVSLEECAHIPLTPEILEKCGFETSTPVADWKKEKFGTLTFKIKNFGKFHFFENNTYSFRPAGNPSMLLRCDLKYLHQLQNLYFALAGEELEINL